MYRLARLSPALFFIFIMSGIIAVIAAYVPNYEKKVYESTSKNTSIVGYPAGDYIPRVTSVEDISRCKVFTVYIKGEDIKETYYYEQNGLLSETKGVVANRSNIINRKISYFFDSMNKKAYIQFCILTLSSGEKVIARLDEKLFDLKSNNEITLPIGEKVEASYPELFKKFQEQYGLAEENTTWYVEMSGSEWRQNELGDSVNKKRKATFALTYIFSFIAITFILYKYAEYKIGDDFEG